MRFEIRTPVPEFSGVRNGVVFTDGVGRTDDRNVADYFRGQGFSVTDTRPAAKTPPDKK